MTRDDIFWILSRATGLYLLVMAIEALPVAITWMRSKERDALHSMMQDSHPDPITAVVAPLIAAFALYAFEKKRAGRQSGGEVKIAMSREDLLWVCCKVVGAYLCVMALGSLSTLVAFGFDNQLAWSFGVLLASAVEFAIGA